MMQTAATNTLPTGAPNVSYDQRISPYTVIGGEGPVPIPQVPPAPQPSNRGRKRKASTSAGNPNEPSLPPNSGFPYNAQDYAPGGVPEQQPVHETADEPPSPESSPQGGPNRVLSTSKRAEQNRKAQRAFRERRDAHVKALEQRSALLDAALASADEANRRWEECRQLVDTLRMDNDRLRAELAGYQQLAANGVVRENGAPGGVSPSGTPHPDGGHIEA